MVNASPSVTHTPISSSRQLSVLAAGDLAMLLIFVVIGRLSHGFTNDWLVNVLRIATPFVLGWAAAALITGVYRANLWQQPSQFLARSAAAWLLADGLAFLLRHFLMADRVTMPFALTSIAFTGLFLLTWRIVFMVWQTRNEKQLQPQ